MTDKETSAAIYAKCDRHYDGEVQGCCLLIADETQRAIGGEVVVGYIAIYGGTSRRSHWWVEKDGQRFDPMGEAKFCAEDFPEWEEVHRDQMLFYSVLPEYEQWRV